MNLIFQEQSKISNDVTQNGRRIDVSIDLVANHKGFFAFRLCTNNNINQDPDQSCFEQHRLRFDDGQIIHLVPNIGHGHSHIDATRIKLRY